MKACNVGVEKHSTLVSANSVRNRKPPSYIYSCSENISTSRSTYICVIVSVCRASVRDYGKREISSTESLVFFFFFASDQREELGIRTRYDTAVVFFFFF